MKQIKLLYLPGIGDDRPRGQDKIIKLWSIFGLKAIFEPINWNNNESFTIKLERIIKRVDELTKNGDKIAVIGVSAGATMAVSVYMARSDKILGLVFICGKLRGRVGVNPRYFQHNPAFYDALTLSEQHLPKLNEQDKAKILTLKSAKDTLVPVSDSIIKGAKVITVPVIGHIAAIYVSLIFYSILIARFLRSIPRVK